MSYLVFTQAECETALLRQTLFMSSLWHSFHQPPPHFSPRFPLLTLCFYLHCLIHFPSISQLFYPPASLSFIPLPPSPPSHHLFFFPPVSPSSNSLPSHSSFCARPSHCSSSALKPAFIHSFIQRSTKWSFSMRCIRHTHIHLFTSCCIITCVLSAFFTLFNPTVMFCLFASFLQSGSAYFVMLVQEYVC